MPVVLAVLAGIVLLAVGLGVGVRVGLRRARATHSGTIEPTPGLGSVPRSKSLPTQIVESLHDGVVVIDRDERAILVNPAARAMGVLNGDHLAFDDLAVLARKSLDAGSRRGGVVDLPLGRIGRGPIAISVLCVPLTGEQHRVGAIALLLTDVTEQRRLEAVRRDFVANVSHELKTPVGALTLLAEAIQDAADDPPTVARFAGRMQHEGARLSRLVRELIELSRVQGAEPLPGEQTVPVSRLLTEVRDQTRLAAEHADISVTFRCGSDLVVRGTEDQLVTALVNLLDNAIAYSPSGTRVAVTAAGREEQGRGVIDIAVSDQGLGIAEADRDRIFERFYRVDPARSRATGGTGLGLAIVKNIVTNHLGSVSVWSAEGAGSTFTIRLPRVHADASPSAAMAGPGSAEKNPAVGTSLVRGTAATMRGSA